jgi:hypothetical protein
VNDPASLERPSYSFTPVGSSRDISHCALMYPELGVQMPATFVINSIDVPNLPDMEVWVNERIAAIQASDATAVIEHSSNAVRDHWHYAIMSYSCGEGELRLTHKMMQLYVQGQKITEFSMIGTSLASVFAEAEPLFDEMIRSFKPA